MTVAGHTMLSSDIGSVFAWDAFRDVVHGTDWRPRISDRDPLAFDLDLDEAFTTILNSAPSWRARDQAKHWIANRIVEMVREDFTKTTIRRASLQVRDDGDQEDISRGIKDRVIRNLRSELHRHFDQSVREWEREAFDHWARMPAPLDQVRFRAFVGLDQVVPQDVMRKAVKYTLNRLPWGIVDEAGRQLFWGNHIAEGLRRRRHPLDDTDRARALIMRAAYALFEDHEARRRGDDTLPPTNKFAIADTIKKAFDEQGVWGPIHLVLAKDREDYRLTQPDLDDPVTENLIARQAPRLFVSGESVKDEVQGIGALCGPGSAMSRP